MSETEVFHATHKNDLEGHGLAGWWWFLSNRLDPLQVPANQDVSCDADAMTATFDVFRRDAAGRRIYHRDEGCLRESVTVPIKYLPSIYGLQDAVRQ